LAYHAKNESWYTLEYIHPRAWYTPFLKTLTAKLYRCGCGYHSSILGFLELYLRRDFERNVTSSLSNPLFLKVKNGRVVATAATVPRYTIILQPKFAKMWVLCKFPSFFPGLLGTGNPEVVGSSPAKPQTPTTQIYMDLSYIDPEARVLNYFFK